MAEAVISVAGGDELLHGPWRRHVVKVAAQQRNVGVGAGGMGVVWPGVGKWPCA